MLGYKFGDISKSVYNKVIKTDSKPRETKENKDNIEAAKGYQFGDITKCVYNKWSKSNYKFGDITKSAYHSITGQFEPFTVNISNPMKEGMLQKRSSLLLTYRTYWVVLQETFLYLFQSKRAYSQCIEVIDLSSYDGVQSISNGLQWSFQVISGNKNQRFVACSGNERKEWIECIMKVMHPRKTQQILDEMKESYMLTEHNVTSLNLQCIAYYIIDLEYMHSESGDPQSLFRNQNFIISMIIWSYMHQHDKKINMDLDDNQRAALKYWQQPMAVAHAVRGGLKQAKIGPIAGVYILPMALENVVGDTMGNYYKVILPLHIVAGAALGAVCLSPLQFGYGFQESYNATK